jgi:hypothetical protein
MLRTTLRKLARGRGATPRRSPRASTRRPTLEALEDRLVPSTITEQVGINGAVVAILIKADAGSAKLARAIDLVTDAQDHTKLDVFDVNGFAVTLLGQFPIASLKVIDVQVAGNDGIGVSDTNGFPFAPGTAIGLVGSGAHNSLDLGGNKTINGNETYTVGLGGQDPQAIRQDTNLALGGSEFFITGPIASVNDNIPITGELSVETPSHAVTLSGQDGITEQLSGVANGADPDASLGGNTLTFNHKPSVALRLDSDSATATLGATAAARDLTAFTVALFGKSDTVNIGATPSTGTTAVQADGFLDRVNLRGNSGAVKVVANSTATVELGSNFFFAQSVTSGINANVSVQGGHLEIADAGNAATKEHVTVTESAVSGSGLFGNGGVVLSYQQLSGLLIFTGRLANTYTVAPSHAGALFSGGIVIDDFASSAGLSVTVDVDDGSGLNLDVINANAKAGSLTIAASTVSPVQAKFNPRPPAAPSGSETVSFFVLEPRGKIVTAGLPSTVNYTGFDSVGLS